MILPDVNVLVQAFVPTSPNYKTVRTWLDRALFDAEPIALYVPILVGFVRVASNRNIWPETVPMGALWKFVDSLRHANVVWIEPTTDYWDIFEELARRSGIVGSTLTDVSYAALAIEHGCRIATFDQDFARIPGVRWFTPGMTGN